MKNDVRRQAGAHRRSVIRATIPLNRSVFGEFQLQRFVYSQREGQAIEAIPLDARLKLPETCTSFLLQSWNEPLMIERLLKRFQFKQVVIVADRGLLSIDNIDGLEAFGREQGLQVDDILAVPVVFATVLWLIGPIGQGLTSKLNGQNPFDVLRQVLTA